ncbi:MAG: membrane dipeptidase [Tindallia sp. MSAO_Bac2]|nr:MAG: membrane dipeptidase [Tindallia sp. MSAO_Bac2]
MIKTKSYKKLSRMALLLIFGTMAATVTAVGMPYRDIHQNAVVMDMHNDTMMKVVDENTWLPVINIGEETPADFQLNLKKAGEGGLDVAFYAAYTAYQTDFSDVMARTNSRSLALLHALHWTVAQNRDSMALAESLGEIEKGIQEGKHVAVASLEGMYQFGPEYSKELLHQYYDLGIRAAGMVWNTPNDLGAGANVANHEENAGLTDKGIEMIGEMNRLGIMVDVSHMNERTFFDTLSVAEAPVIASHSGVDGIRPHVRNLSDEQLLQLKENGGVVSINFWRTAVADPGSSASVGKLVDHIDYVVDLIGIEHVGLGSDFDGAAMPQDLPDAAYLPKITEELVNRGYDKEAIEKILGGNNLRVLKAVEEHAGRQRKQSSSNSRGLGLTIIPDIQMGEIFDTTKPLLTATVADHGDGTAPFAQYRIIVNGIPYEAEYDAKAGKITHQMETDLLGRGTTADKGNFHAVTFEGKDAGGSMSRETTIIYVR